MVRMWLRDDQFERLTALLPSKLSDPGRTAVNNRLFVEAVLWVARTGSPCATFLLSLGLGTASINALAVGRVAVSGIGSWRNWRRTRILRKCSSTARLVAHTSTRQARVKKRPSARALMRRTEHEDSRLGGGAGIARSIPPDRR